MRIIFFTNGWVLAHVCRPLEVAKVLRDMGHEGVFAGEHRHLRSRLPLCEREGFRTLQCMEINVPYVWDRYLRYGWWVAPWDLLHLRKFAPLDEILDAQVRLIQREKPDLVVADGTASLSTAAYITGTPFAAIMNAYWLHFYRPTSVFRPMIRLWDKFYLSRLRYRIYRKYGCEPVNAIDLLFSSRIISPGLEEFDAYAANCPEWESVGPILAQLPCDRPEWLERLGDGQTNVYITMGSTGALDDFLRRVYPALAALPYRFIVTTAKQVSEETITMAPGNFLFADYAPGEEILARSSALVFHGGNGTMYQALAAGVPMIGIPQHLEQDLNIRKSVELGFGIRLRQRGSCGEKLARALNKLLTNPSYRRSAMRFSERIKARSGAERAARILLEVAGMGMGPQVREAKPQ